MATTGNIFNGNGSIDFDDLVRLFKEI